VRVQGGFSVRRLSVCVFSAPLPCSTLLHTTQHTRLTCSGGWPWLSGGVCGAWTWANAWPSGWWIEQQLMMTDTRIAVICGEHCFVRASNLLSPLPPNSLASLGVSGRSLQVRAHPPPSLSRCVQHCCVAMLACAVSGIRSYSVTGSTDAQSSRGWCGSLHGSSVWCERRPDSPL
jgi:hypothetical protein